MKFALILIVTIFWGLPFLLACGDDKYMTPQEIEALTPAQLQARNEAIRRNSMWKFAHSIRYFKDPRTGLCYAYISRWEGANSGGPAIALTLVPCDSIPEDLLIIPEKLPEDFR